MEYQLALPPHLGLRPDELVSAWNAMADQRQLAEVRLSPSTAVAYDPLLLGGAITIISAVTTGVITNVLSELIKQLLQQKGLHKQVQVQPLKQPDGLPLLIVTIEEE